MEHSVRDETIDFTTMWGWGWGGEGRCEHGRIPRWLRDYSLWDYSGVGYKVEPSGRDDTVRYGAMGGLTLKITFHKFLIEGLPYLTVFNDPMTVLSNF